MNDFVDPRVRVREALRRLLREGAPAWDDESLARFRNRLLDETGSDARPLAELLLEAVRRGIRQQLSDLAAEPARWDTVMSPFILRWSAERFVQPEMARWAVECWGLSFGVIRDDQVLIAPAARAAATTAAVPRIATSERTTTPARSAISAVASAPRRGMPPTPIITPRSRSGASSVARPQSRSMAAPARPGAAQSITWLPSLSTRMAYGIAWLAAASYVFFIVTIGLGMRKSRKAEEAAAAAAAAVSPVSKPAPSEVVNAASPPIGAPTKIATSISGVPSPRLDDASRMLVVEPVRRAEGAPVLPSATALTTPTPAPATFDRIELVNGTRMSGRVDVIRAGAVVFRDGQTGLRHEFPKDSIEVIITEFGTSVRFRASTITSRADDGASRGSSNPATRSSVSSVRRRGVGGRYLVRYDAATSVGSRECGSVWTRSPGATDQALATHVPDADTLLLAFVGGQNFPANVDADGNFASTSRIVPDQARTSTALVTRLTGRFTNEGTLSLTVSIVYFRRMRAGPDLACTVQVNASGLRQDAP